MPAMSISLSKLCKKSKLGMMKALAIELTAIGTF
jgi:hypothetical protein